METAAFCEIDPFCRKVLKKHWPSVPIYKDIRTLTKERLQNDGITDISVLTGGIPCQPFSVAGQRKGADDDRHLWPAMLSIISNIRPDWVVCENVVGIIGMELDNILFDLECIEYAAWTFVIPATAVGGNHRRERIWIVANTEGKQSAPKNYRRKQTKTKREEQGKPRGGYSGDVPRRGGPAEPGICGIADGIPEQLDRLKSLGNSVVPQIPEIIGRAIMEANQ